MWKNVVELVRPQVTLWPRALHATYLSLQTYSWDMYRLSSATMVARTRLHVTFIGTLPVWSLIVRRFMCYNVKGNNPIFIQRLFHLHYRIYRMRLCRYQKPRYISLVHHFACRLIQQRSVLEVSGKPDLSSVSQNYLCVLYLSQAE
jgi:hypothetical protein